MTQYPEALDHMLAAWNERDLDRIRGHLEQALSPDVEFADPANFVRGIDAFEQMVREFRSQTPNARCERASGLDSHHGRYRYAWNVFDGDHLAVPGFDVTTVDEQGLVERVDGFFGPLPPLAD